MLADPPQTESTKMLASQPVLTTNPSATALRDEQLQSLAREALKHCGYRGLSRLECTVIKGTVVLAGAVNSFYYKQVAQAAVQRVFRGLEAPGKLENRIDVRAP